MRKAEQEKRRMQKEMQKRLAEATETCDKLRRETANASELQRANAEGELRKLLAEQRRSLDGTTASSLRRAESSRACASAATESGRT